MPVAATFRRISSGPGSGTRTSSIRSGSWYPYILAARICITCASLSLASRKAARAVRRVQESGSGTSHPDRRFRYHHARMSVLPRIIRCCARWSADGCVVRAWRVARCWTSGSGWTGRYGSQTMSSPHRGPDEGAKCVNLTRRSYRGFMALATTSPVTGEVLRRFDELTSEELEDKLARAAATAASYRLTSVEERAGWLEQAADHLEKEVESVSGMITTEMGKTFRAAEEEVAKCVHGLRFYAAEGPAFQRDLDGDGGRVGAKQAFMTYQPIGVVLAVMPWNLPLWQAMRFAAPALMAGNAGLLKHASNVPQCALY